METQTSYNSKKVQKRIESQKEIINIKKVGFGIDIKISGIRKPF